MCYGADLEKALTAGLLHDCAKGRGVKEQIRYCEKHGILLTEAELAMPALIHAKLGAYLAEKDYGITDPEILDAITYHTTGRPDMSLLEKIIYIADYIEPNRRIIRDWRRSAASCSGTSTARSGSLRTGRSAIWNPAGKPWIP